MADYDIYKLPAAVVNGRDFTLDKAPEVGFRIVLPMQCNEEFQLRLMSAVTSSTPEGKGFDPFIYSVERRKLILSEYAVVAHWGLDEGDTPQEFFKRHPLAAREILAKVDAATATADEEFDAALGN